MVPKRKSRCIKLDSHQSTKAARSHATTRPNPTRANLRVPKVTPDGFREPLAAKSSPVDTRPAWLKAHGKCDCIACHGFKLEVMPIYTGDSKHPYRCPYCGEYLTSWGVVKRHMGKIIVPHPERTCCPQLQIGVDGQGKINYRDSGDMRLLWME